MNVVRSGAFEPGELALDREEALRYLGYAGQSVDDGLMERFEALASACERQTRPLWAWGLFPLGNDAGASGLVVDLKGGSLELPGESLARHVDGAHAVVLMACTLGAACDREIRRLGALAVTDSMLYSAAASALTEAAADAVDRRVRYELGLEGKGLTSRFSPGYGDLPLDVQPGLLSALDAQKLIGLHASESFLLVPTKSVTAVMGVRESGSVEAGKPTEDLCAGCAQSSRCPLRAKGARCWDR